MEERVAVNYVVASSSLVPASSMYCRICKDCEEKRKDLTLLNPRCIITCVECNEEKMCRKALMLNVLP